MNCSILRITITDKFCKRVNDAGSDVQYVPFETSPFFLSIDVVIQYAYIESKSIIVNTLFYGAYKIVSTTYCMAIRYNTIRYDTLKYNTLHFLYSKLRLFLRILTYILVSSM
jgi:hypothetical protein